MPCKKKGKAKKSRSKFDTIRSERAKGYVK